MLSILKGGVNLTGYSALFVKTVIIDSNGTEVVQYVYDAWGNHKISGSNTTLGNLNPFRYRSYFYDTESKLYYLKTRYYDPEVGRFINMDGIQYADPETINGLNLYAYCGNNPVMGYDPEGTWNWKKFWVGVSMVFTAVTAITLAITTFGAGTPLAMGIIAGGTLLAGGLTGLNGVATLIEAGTGYNFMRDGVFHGNEFAYDIYASTVEALAIAGSFALSFYHSTSRYKASKYGQKFLGKGYSKVGSNRWVSADGMRQMRWDTTGHYIDGLPSANHFNLYTFSNNYWMGGRNPIISDLHLTVKLFNFIIG